MESFKDAICVRPGIAARADEAGPVAINETAWHRYPESRRILPRGPPGLSMSVQPEKPKSHAFVLAHLFWWIEI